MWSHNNKHFTGVPQIMAEKEPAKIWYEAAILGVIKPALAHLYSYSLIRMFCLAQVCHQFADGMHELNKTLMLSVIPIYLYHCCTCWQQISHLPLGYNYNYFQCNLCGIRRNISWPIFTKPYVWTEIRTTSFNKCYRYITPSQCTPQLGQTKTATNIKMLREY